MNSRGSPAWIGCSHFSDKITDFKIDSRSSKPFSFGFSFPEKLESLAVPSYNGFRSDNDKGFSPRTPNSIKQNPEEPIYCMNLRSSVSPFHNGQLLTKYQVLGSQMRSDTEFYPNK